MIRIERVSLPPGMRAFARHENGAVFVYVPRGVSPRERAAAIQEALRAAPDAGWRSGRHSVLLPALAGGAGLRAAPESRWPYWVLLTAAVAAVASVIAITVMQPGAAPGRAAGPGTALQPGGPSSPGPGQATGPGARSTASRPGSVPAGPDERKPGPRAPKPQTSGTPVPVPTPGRPPTPGTSPTPGRSPTTPPPSGAPTPSSSSGPAPGPSQSSGQPPGPSPSPSPSASGKPKGPSPVACVIVLGVTICV
jgi:hypothetical protein